MYLTILKIVFASGIFFLTLIAGFAPLRISRHNINLLRLCDAFASGVFFGTALLHLLPEAVTKFSLASSSSYPLAYLVCVVTCVLLVIIERGIFTYSNLHLADDRTQSKIVVPIFLVSLLGIHSLVEGGAIGANTNIFEALTIFFAVFAHKGSESFALAANLQRLGLATKNIRQIIAIFSLVTPIGIFIASYITSAAATNASYGNLGDLLAGYFNAIAAGTFLYLGAEHFIGSKESFEKMSEAAALISGVALMAVVAAWV